MNQIEFISAINNSVLKSSVESVKSILIKPAGRNPNKDLLSLSAWYNALDEVNKSLVDNVISMTSDMTTFGFLCVLDGVRPIEDGFEKGVLKLIYQKENTEVILAGDNAEFLHDKL